MRGKLESKKMVMEKMSIRSRLAKEDASKQEEQLTGEVQSLLVAGVLFLDPAETSKYNIFLLEIIKINKFSKSV